MAFKISGFGGTHISEKGGMPTYQQERKQILPRKSVVQIYFPERNMTLSYYNDQFDLKVGDRVYVDGKMEGHLGLVTNVNYNFKIKLSAFQKVVAVVDTEVHGQLYMAGSHFVAFEPDVLPKEQITLWFCVPANEEEEYVFGNDESAFDLDNLEEMGISAAIAERGHEYHMENRVCYLCVDGTQGYAIVKGHECYTVEFSYRDGQISHLVCDCPCSYTCKHEFTVMLQLRELLEIIAEYYSDEYERTAYFAAVTKSVLFSFAVDGKKEGGFVL